jgi:hypothetical protein
MYPVHKSLPRCELEAAARRLPCLKLLPALSPNNFLDRAWDDAENLIVVADGTIAGGDFGAVADLGGVPECGTLATLFGRPSC